MSVSDCNASFLLGWVTMQGALLSPQGHSYPRLSGCGSEDCAVAQKGTGKREKGTSVPSF